MSEIVPTITATTPDDYARELEKLNFVPRLHIDIADGEFAPTRTVNLNQIYWGEDKIIDLHLMMKRPGEWLHQIVALKPNLVILHAEIADAAANLPRIFDHLHKFNIKCGVALLTETWPEQVKEILKIVDQVLVFGGHLGYQGGVADLKQLEKVAQIREIWRSCHPELAVPSTRTSGAVVSEPVLNSIQESSLSQENIIDSRVKPENDKILEIAWDGGANLENVKEIAAAGIDIINVGSAIAKSEDPEKTYTILTESTT